MNEIDYIIVAGNDNLEEDSKKCPIPLSIFPNQMGINLRSVSNIIWETGSDGQLSRITINFLPEKSN